jgi:hypothetical protein
VSPACSGRVGRRNFAAGLSQNGAWGSRLTPLPSGERPCDIGGVIKLELLTGNYRITDDRLTRPTSPSNCVLRFEACSALLNFARTGNVRVKYPTEDNFLVHLIEAAQAALDTGENELARHLVTVAYSGFDILQVERDHAAGAAAIMALVERAPPKHGP